MREGQPCWLERPSRFPGDIDDEEHFLVRVSVCEMKAKNQILEEVRTIIRRKHYSLSTENAYTQWIGRYYDFCRRNSSNMPSDHKAESFLTELACKFNVSAKTQNQALAAILFLYHHVLRRPFGVLNAVRAKKPATIRLAPSRNQIQLLRSHLLSQSKSTTLLLVDLLYGSGLRVAEPFELRIRDILIDSHQLVIRGAKGGKDRLVPVPSSCMDRLEAHLQRARGLWAEHLKYHPNIGVPLPDALAKKYPQAKFSMGFFWLFPAARLCRDPRSGTIVRYHVLPDTLQRAVYLAAKHLQLEHIITPHALRHAYATHSRESIEVLSKLMGHYSIKTTSGYRHPEVDQASNPLDDMLQAIA